MSPELAAGMSWISSYMDDWNVKVLTETEKHFDYHHTLAQAYPGRIAMASVVGSHTIAENCYLPLNWMIG